ncbi:MAG: hypothetical protein K0V04_33015 [Deltaproteobacteria bacterium]|nr:hypothetical protein [Deltaproteobacteria bacterium]
MTITPDQCRHAALEMLESAHNYLRQAHHSTSSIESGDTADSAPLSVFIDTCRVLARAYLTCACKILDPGRLVHDVEQFLDELPGGQAAVHLGAEQYAAVVAAWIDQHGAAGR